MLADPKPLKNKKHLKKWRKYPAIKRKIFIKESEEEEFDDDNVVGKNKYNADNKPKKNQKFM